MPTLNQRLKTLAADDAAKLKQWKDAIKWANDRLSDHEVHVYKHVDGKMQEEKKLLFADFHPSKSGGYDDAQVVEMVEWFVFAKLQYTQFLSR